MNVRQLIGLAAILAMATPVVSLGQETAPPEILGKVFAKALDYDRNIHRHDPDIVRIGFLSASSDEPVKAIFDALSQANATISEKPVDTASTAWSDRTTLTTWLKDQHIVFLFIPAGLDNDLTAILQACRDADVGSLAGDAAYVGKGASFGVAVESGKPKMLIDLTEAREEGSNFTAQFLQLGTIVAK